MNNSIKAISRIYADIIKIHVMTGDCVVIKSSSVLGMDFTGVTHVSDLITRLQNGLLQQTDAPRITDFGFAIMGPKSVMAPTPRKISDG